jgi:hypothetical protein
VVFLHRQHESLALALSVSGGPRLGVLKSFRGNSYTVVLGDLVGELTYRNRFSFLEWLLSLDSTLLAEEYTERRTEPQSSLWLG